jgi:hypothetical protein
VLGLHPSQEAERIAMEEDALRDAAELRAGRKLSHAPVHTRPLHDDTRLSERLTTPRRG